MNPNIADAQREATLMAAHNMTEAEEYEFNDSYVPANVTTTNPWEK